MKQDPVRSIDEEVLVRYYDVGCEAGDTKISDEVVVS